MKKFSKILLRISLKFFVITLSLYIILGVIFTFVFGPEIEKSIKNNINSELNLNLSNSTNIKFSLFEHFPYGSVSLKNLEVIDSSQKSPNKLVSLEEAIIKINIWDLVLSKYNLKNIVIKNGAINIGYNKNGVSNFDILNNKDSSPKNFKIDNIELININISYYNDLDSHNLNSKIKNLNINLDHSKGSYSLKINGGLSIQELTIKDLSYINRKNVELNTEIFLNADSIKITAPSIIIENVNFSNFHYDAFNNKYLLSLEVIDQKIENIISVTPDNLKYLFDQHKLNGIIDASIHLEKEKININPYCEISFLLTNGAYEHLTMPFKISKVNCNGNFTNGKDRNLLTSKIAFKDFSSIKNDGYINGYFEITNFSNYHLTANLSSSWQLTELNSFVKKSPFKNLNGKLSGNIKYNGSLSFNEEMKKHISLSTYSGKWRFDNVSFNYKKSPLNFVFKESEWLIQDDIIEIKDDKFYVSKSDLSFTGQIDNLFLYLLDQKEKMTINGKLISEDMDFEELFTIKDINDSDSKTEQFISVMPRWIESNLVFDILQFKYRDFNATEFIGEITYNSEKLELKGDNMSMNALEGKIDGDILYYENKIHDLVLKANIQLNKVNIQKGFKSFNNFNQTFILDKNIRGNGTSNIYLQSMWDRNYNFYPKSLTMNAQLKIEDGELVNFQPMYSLSDYVRIEELKNVKFATLENKVRIEDEKVIVPEMDIYSTALSVHASGTHSFENNMDYKIRLLLSDILSKKVKDTTIHLEDLENEHSDKTTIQLQMKGNVEDPIISLDQIQLRKDVVEGIIKETEEITNIIKNDILDNTDPMEEYQKEDSGIELEWEDENK